MRASAKYSGSRGAAGLLLSTLLITGILSSVMVAQRKARFLQKEQAVRLDGLEGFYAAELAAFQAVHLEASGLSPTGTADGDGRYPTALSSVASQWSNYVLASPSTAIASPYDPSGYETGTALNYARTRQYVVSDSVIRRYEADRLRLKPSTASDTKRCGQISFRSSNARYNVCFIERVLAVIPSPSPTPSPTAPVYRRVCYIERVQPPGRNGPGRGSATCGGVRTICRQVVCDLVPVN